jgi:hypothetical protein
MSAVRNRECTNVATNPARTAGDLSRRELLAFAAWGLAAGVASLCQGRERAAGPADLGGARLAGADLV